MIAETGDCIQISREGVQLSGKVPVGRIFIDEGSHDEVEEVVMRDRRHLSEDGIVVVVLAIDKATGRMGSQPEIIARGFLYLEAEDVLISEARELVRKSGGNSLRPRLREAEARLAGRNDRTVLKAGLREAEAMYRAMGAPDPAARLAQELGL